MQLPLNIQLSEINRFGNFISGGNSELVDVIENTVSALATDKRHEIEVIFAWGGPGNGKTHLLQAACQQARDLAIDSVYVPIGQAGLENPSILEDLEALPLVCIDGVHLVAGNAEWESALFVLYEGMRGRGLLLIASDLSPAESGFSLPDLVSRFKRGLVYGLKSLSDAQKMEVLRQRARLRGWVLSDDVVAYIEKNYPRDMASLGRLLEQLDHESLVQQRKVTVPFVKSLLGS